jgi:exoribonuclease II
METDSLHKDSLVLYKKHPARVLAAGDKLEIELASGETARVRPKDVLLLHPGPLANLRQLNAPACEVELAWQIMLESGGQYTLAELAELACGEFTPAAAWSAWQWLDDGLYFRGSPENITACPPDEVAQTQAARQARSAEAQAWEDFLGRARTGKVSMAADARYLRELEDLAFGRRKDSRLLNALGYPERPENAHARLLEWGVWDEQVNPYPMRSGVAAAPPELNLPGLPDEPRLDLTGLPAFAIDDRNNQDPDDAVSLEVCRFDSQGHFLGGRIWVHIADASALVPPESPADLEARSRGATLYLPEGPLPMLPWKAVQTLGLGLQAKSPALSFGIELDSAAQIVNVDIQPSWVRVQRLSYEAAETQLETGPLTDLYRLTQAYLRRRMASGALMIDLPEVIVHVVGGEVTIEPVLRLHSRALVRESMLMTGEAAAFFALQHRIAIPFATQPAPDLPQGIELPQFDRSDTALSSTAESYADPATESQEMARCFALRRFLKRGQVSSLPSVHSGVGLQTYTRATSPLRRYLDLAVHQQLRACLCGGKPLDEQAILERVGMSEAATSLVNQVEFQSRRHWTLVYLMQNPGWHGKAVLVEKTGMRGFALVPDLALEIPLHMRDDLPVGSSLEVTVTGLNLPNLDIHIAPV